MRKQLKQQQPESSGDFDVPLFMTYNGATYYYITDGNKNVIALIDSTGTHAADYTYSPFGQTLTATGTMAQINPFRFSSEYHDDETDLVYYNYRYYSPELGRWTRRDPIEEEGGWNLYHIGRNNLLLNVDNLGLSAKLREVTVVLYTSVDENWMDAMNMIADNLLAERIKIPDGAFLQDLVSKILSTMDELWQDCKCINNLVFLGHGNAESPSDFFHLGVTTPFAYEPLDPDHKLHLQTFWRIIRESKKYFCENAIIEIRSCYLGDSEAGKKLAIDIVNENNRPVLIHSGQVQANGHHIMFLPGGGKYFFPLGE